MGEVQPVERCQGDPQQGKVLARRNQLRLIRLDTFEFRRQARCGRIRRRPRTLAKIAAPREAGACVPGGIDFGARAHDFARTARPDLHLGGLVVEQHRNPGIGGDHPGLGRAAIGVEPQPPALRIESAQHHDPRIDIGGHDHRRVHRRLAIARRADQPVATIGEAVIKRFEHGPRHWLHRARRQAREDC